MFPFALRLKPNRLRERHRLRGSVITASRRKAVLQLLSFARLLIVALFGALAAPVLAQQDTPEAQLPHTGTITVNARLVVLDVNVTDAKGHALTNLTRDDFQVYENGQLQRIRSFETPSVHALPEVASAEGLRAVFDPAKPANFGQSPVTVLVLDQLNTHFSDSSFARRELRSFLTKQPALLTQPTELLSVSDAGFRQLAGFSRDREALLKSLDAAPVKYDWKLQTEGRSGYGPLERMDDSLRALEQIAQSNARIAGRKNLIWVGGGFPSIDPQMLTPKDQDTIRSTVRHITDVLLETRVILYAVDPSSSAAGMTEITNEMEQDFGLATADSISGSNRSFDAGEDFDRLGPATGGRVIRGLNDVGAQIATAESLGTDFYSIGYTPTSNAETPGRFRKITITSRVSGLTIRTREGYFSEAAQQQTSKESIVYDLSAAAESTVPLNGLRVSVEHNRSVNADLDAYLVHVGAANLTWSMREDGVSTAHVEILGAALTNKGKMLNHVLHAATARAKPGVNLRDETKIADFEFNVQPAAKAATLRFIVRDAASGRMGSFDLRLADF